MEDKNKNESIYSLFDKEELSLMDTLNIFFLKSQNLTVKQKIIFFRLLATMINSGITLSKSIKILEKQEKNINVLKIVLRNFLFQIKQGKGLSYCFSLYPKSFSNAEIGMIQAGEKTGKLNQSLNDIANQIEKINSINGKLRGALIYPLLVIIVVIGVIIVMMVLVVPKLLEMFQGTENLPTSTKVLIAVSDFFVYYWYVLIIGIVVFIISISIWKITDSGRYNFDKIMLIVPVFGNITRKIILSKFSRVLAGMMQSGVSIVESLKITSDAVGNEVYRQRILLLRDDVQKGLKIYESLEEDPLFPEMMVSMIEVGEQTAKVDEIIIKIADFYDEEVDNVISIINKLLEPFIIVFMAVVVGFIAIAIMQPIMNLSDTIQNI